jgi:hypothetical protein
MSLHCPRVIHGEKRTSGVEIFHGNVDMPCPREPSTRHFLAWVPSKIYRDSRESLALSTTVVEISHRAAWHESLVKDQIFSPDLL